MNLALLDEKFLMSDKVLAVEGYILDDPSKIEGMAGAIDQKIALGHSTCPHLWDVVHVFDIHKRARVCLPDQDPSLTHDQKLMFENGLPVQYIM